jgi:hypothetical protein
VRSRKWEDLHAPIAEGHVSSAACHWGNISIRLGAAMPPATAKDVLGGLKLTGEIVDRLELHLRANAVDLNQTPLTTGRWLTIDPQQEEISGVSGPGAEQALHIGRALARGQHRPPFAFPDD